MAQIRSVLQHPKTRKWAYVEYSDESDFETILGEKEFDTQIEALEWAQGFTPFSYEWKSKLSIQLEKSYLNRKQFRAFELTLDVDHPLVKHYGQHGVITKESQIRTHAMVAGGAGYEVYGCWIVFDEDGKTEAFTKEQFEKAFISTFKK